MPVFASEDLLSVTQSQAQYLALPHKDALQRIPTRDVQNAQPLKVRFHVLLTGGDTDVLLCCNTLVL
jgi:hypothetical protein